MSAVNAAEVAEPEVAWGADDPDGPDDSDEPDVVEVAGVDPAGGGVAANRGAT